MKTDVTHALSGRKRLCSALLICVALVSIFVTQTRTTTAAMWTVRVGTAPAAIAAGGGRVVVANSGDQSVSVLDARSGATRATIPAGQAPVALTLDGAQGRVFTLNTCRTMAAYPWCQPSMSILDLQSGTLLGTISTAGGPTAIAADAQAGWVFAANYNAGTVSMIDPTTGGLRRTVDVGGPPVAVAVDARAHRVFVAIEGPRGRVALLDSRTGALLHTGRTGRFVGTVLNDARSRRALVQSDGGVYLLDARTGRTLRVIKHTGMLLAIDERDGRALVAANGQLHLLATRDGTTVAAIDDGGALRTSSIDDVAVDPVAGRFFVAAHDVTRRAGTPTTVGYLAVIDGRSGRLLRMRSLDKQATALAVDAAAHRVFIVNADSMDASAGQDAWQQLERWVRRMLPGLPLPPSTASTGGTVTVLNTERL
ncbi:MAG TPA: PQQ-binding-like beta-propeller repeat protein [Chloroflexota bacterium]|nr:PQQ-binding-like beta-propeller repeat protein [Chloroflexota bacterium]